MFWLDINIITIITITTITIIRIIRGRVGRRGGWEDVLNMFDGGEKEKEKREEWEPYDFGVFMPRKPETRAFGMPSRMAV